jgi:hypothetical protein
MTRTGKLAARGELLERTASAVGESWARTCLADLVAEGRAACGAWPGTITQARTRVRAVIFVELARGRHAPAGPGEIEKATRAAYDRARAVWRASASSDAGSHSTKEGAG